MMIVRNALYKHLIYQVLLLFLLLPGAAFGQENSLLTTPFTKIDSLQAVAPRPMIIFIHTDWCRYCENMRHTSLRDAEAVRQLNERFYYLALDAETEQTLPFAGQTFPFRATGHGSGVHTLATALGTIDGQLQYPTLVIMNADYEITFQYGGFLAAEALKMLLDKY